MDDINTLELKWKYEDELSKMDDKLYDLIYEQSRVIDGVRMFPYVSIFKQNPDKRFRNFVEVKYYLR